MSKLKNLPALLLSFAKPAPTRAFWLIAAVYTLVQGAFIGVVLLKHEFSLGDPTVLVYFAEKYLFDFAVFFTINAALARATRRAWPGLAFSVVYLFSIASNTLLYYFGGTLVELHHFSLITPYSLSGFANVWSIGFAALFVLAIAVLRRPLLSLAMTASWRSVVRWAVMWGVLLAVDVPERVAATKESDERLDRVIMVFRNAQLEYSAQNSIAAFMNDVVFKGLAENLYEMKGSDKYRKFMKRYHLFSEEHRISRDTGEHREVLDRYGIPIGPRDYEDLGLAEFDRVIMIFVESLTLDFFECYNDKLNTPLTGFLCSDEVRARTFTGMTTSGTPTLQGLTVVFSSHPNYNIQKVTGDLNSFPKLLKRRGYETRFIRSASKFFANENIIFKKWGFDRIDAREDFFKREDLKKFIYGWGLEDRKLYEELEAYLEQKRGRKVFVALLGTDTHPLNGQRYFKHLKYPPLPKGFNRAYGPARHFAKAVHHVDFDLGRLIRRLEKKGLYDEGTLIVITADHSCPPNSVTRRVKGHGPNALGRIPFIVLTPQNLPEADMAAEASQIDIAPTLFHLLGLPIPRGWWGDSLFHEGRKVPAIGFDKNMLVIGRGKDRRLLNMGKRDPAAEEINEVFSTVYPPD